MTKKESEQLLSLFRKRADNDTDGYLVVHISEKEDFYKLVSNGIDEADVVLLVNELIKEFDISIDMLYQALKSMNYGDN